MLEIARHNEERWASVMQMGCLFNVNVNASLVLLQGSAYSCNKGITTSQTAKSHGLLFFSNELSEPMLLACHIFVFKNEKVVKQTKECLSIQMRI